VRHAVEIRILGLRVRFAALQAQIKWFIFFKPGDYLSRELGNSKLEEIFYLK
jgi:hypothetical protein